MDLERFFANRSVKTEAESFSYRGDDPAWYEHELWSSFSSREGGESRRDSQIWARGGKEEAWEDRAVAEQSEAGVKDSRRN